MRELQKKSGFTIIELLVVIAIIAILATIILVSISGARKRAREARRISDIRQLQVALSLYDNTNGAYPASLAPLAPTYIATVPVDPLTQSAYLYAPLYGNSTTVCTSYHLGAKMEIYNPGPGSPFSDDVDGTPGGFYPDGDGATCGSNTPDFDGTDSASNPIYDVRP